MRPLNKAFIRSSVIAAVFVMALAASAAAAPQHGHFGGVAHSHVIVHGGFYNPYWGSFGP